MENGQDSALRSLQLKELAGLLEMRRVCRENGIRYYMTGGTLLGAVRHHGFIPWDDDMDIIVPRPDFERFIRLCVQEHALGPDYYVQTSETDPTYPHCFAKLRHGPVEPYSQQVGTGQGFIDVFPLDKCPDRKAVCVFYFGMLHVLNNAILYHTDENFVCTFKTRYLFPIWRVLRHLPKRWLIAMRTGLRKMMDALSSGREIGNVGGIYGYPREVHEAAWFAEPAELEFEGHHFSVPAGWDALLTKMFGDYMTPPPEDQRRGHIAE